MSNSFCFCLFNLRLYIFQSFWDGFLGFTSTISNEDEVTCSRTQHRAPGEDRTHDLAIIQNHVLTRIDVYETLCPQQMGGCERRIEVFVKIQKTK